MAVHGSTWSAGTQECIARAYLWMSDVTAGVEVDLATAVIEHRMCSGEADVRSASQISDTALLEAVPWRTFRFYQGQRHYSGKYWAATERDHVIYESRLELSSLLLADFDPANTRIVAQPFQLSAVVNGRIRRHIPDFLWGSGSGLTIIDVVRAQRLAENPKIQILCGWTREVLEALGWEYRVLSEQPPVLLGNVRFLAGYRREQYVDQKCLDRIRCAMDGLGGLRLDDAERRVAETGPSLRMRNALMHLLWKQEILVDLATPLRPSSVLEVRR